MILRNLAFTLVATRQRLSRQIVSSFRRSYSSISLSKKTLNVGGKSLLGFSLLGLGTSGIDGKEFMAAPVSPIQQLETDEAMKYRFEKFVLKVQKAVCTEILKIEEDFQKLGLDIELDENQKPSFVIDRWIRPEGGGGITCVLEDGQVFERAGCNISVVHGQLPLSGLQQMRSRGHTLELKPGETSLPFFACGVSSVIHPRNPHIPTVHFNYRYFEIAETTDDPEKPKISWWFGGGTDLTPYILHDEDATHFHETLKKACDKHDLTYYPKFKKLCDDYFVNTHRGERRGVGGIFFDDLEGPGKDETFAYVQSCAHAVIPCYFPLITKNMNKAYDYADRQWQLLRRGRYVEFNLVHDRGTKFGLATPQARIESILMSLPREAKWKYNYVPPEGSEQARLVELLRNPKEWIKKVDAE